MFLRSVVYSNSLLATLNTRRLVRGRGTDHGPNNPEDFTMIHTQFQVEPAVSFFSFFFLLRERRNRHEWKNVILILFFLYLF